MSMSWLIALRASPASSKWDLIVEHPPRRVGVRWPLVGAYFCFNSGLGPDFLPLEREGEIFSALVFIHPTANPELPTLDHA
jgi:hypothetical protein